MLKKLIKVMAFGTVALFAQASLAQSFSSGIPAGWSGVGSYGTLGADGPVTLAPGGGSQYGWVSTQGGITGASPFGFGNETTGSYLRSNTFAANANAVLDFKFNYITSDGAGFADYGWARLLNADLTQAALLFTARTTPSGDTIPGFSMPTPEATITPVSTPIIAGGVQWTPLDPNSSSCFSTGCGYTGWVSSTYTIANAGNYILEFGVTNWADSGWQSGMAFDGITVAGNPITPVPEPETYAMMLAGLGMLGFMARRRKLKAAA